MTSRGIKWSDEQSETLRALYAEGLSCMNIARRMDCGFTRNAVIGRVYRMKLAPPKVKKHTRIINGSAKGVRAKRSTTTHQHILTRMVRNNGGMNDAKQFRIVSTMAYKVRCVEVVPLNLSLMELPDNGCRYIPGEDLLYCGHPQQGGSSYCPSHHDLCREPPRALLTKAFVRAA